MAALLTRVLLTKSVLPTIAAYFELQRCHKGCAAYLQGRLGENSPHPSVLVPGAGLGRLCHDIASLGFECEVVLSHLIIWTISAKLSK